MYREEGTLTTRQRQVMGLLALGLSNREMAEMLYISRKTVESHMASLRLLLGVDTVRQLIVVAARTAARS